MNIVEAINHYLELKPCKNWIESVEPSFFFEFAETVITAYEKEKEKNKSLEQENSFLKMMYRGTDEFKAIENLAKEE